MKQCYKTYYAKVFSAFESIKESYIELLSDIQSEESTDELTDAAYVFNQAAALLHELQKNATATHEHLEKIVCARWVRESDGEPIRTEYCTATPKVGQCAKFPKKGEPDYVTFLTDLGVPADIVGKDVLRPHWPGVVEHITSLAVTGRPMPKGLETDKVYSVFSLTIKKKKGILENE